MLLLRNVCYLAQCIHTTVREGCATFRVLRRARSAHTTFHVISWTERHAMKVSEASLSHWLFDYVMMSVTQDLLWGKQKNICIWFDRAQIKMIRWVETNQSYCVSVLGGALLFLPLRLGTVYVWLMLFLIIARTEIKGQYSVSHPEMLFCLQCVLMLHSDAGDSNPFDPGDAEQCF